MFPGVHALSVTVEDQGAALGNTRVAGIVSDNRVTVTRSLYCGSRLPCHLVTG